MHGLSRIPSTLGSCIRVWCSTDEPSGQDAAVRPFTVLSWSITWLALMLQEATTAVAAAPTTAAVQEVATKAPAPAAAADDDDDDDDDDEDVDLFGEMTPVRYPAPPLRTCKFTEPGTGACLIYYLFISQP